MSIELEDMVSGEWYGILHTDYQIMLNTNSSEGSMHHFRVSGHNVPYRSLSPEYSYSYLLGLLDGLGIDNVCIISIKEEYDDKVG